MVPSKPYKLWRLVVEHNHPHPPKRFNVLTNASSSPYVTAVGATFLPYPHNAFIDAEVAVNRFPSGGVCLSLSSSQHQLSEHHWPAYRASQISTLHPVGRSTPSRDILPLIPLTSLLTKHFTMPPPTTTLDSVRTAASTTALDELIPMSRLLVMASSLSMRVRSWSSAELLLR